MNKFSVTILGIIALQLISGILGRPENYRLSEKQIEKLRDIATQWAKVINFEEEPCENFYDFMCSSRGYPDFETTYSKNILENILNAKTESLTATEKKFLTYSTTCGEFKEEESEEFIKWFKLENSMGNWPAFVENWDDSKFNLPLTIAELNSYGYPVVFTHDLIFDYRNYLEPTLQIRKQYLVDIENEKDLFKSKFEKLGVKNPEDVLTDAVLFEKTLRVATESLKSTTDKKIKFSEFKDYLPEMDWDKQIEIIYDGKLPDDFTVLMNNHEELKEIVKAISKLSPRVIANYFSCAFVYTLNGHSNQQTLKLFMPVIKQAFLKHFFDQNTKEILKGMYVTIMETVQDRNISLNFKTRYSSDQIAKFIDEEIFGFANEEDLANEFKEISSNSNECVKNDYRLQKLYKRRLAKPFFNYDSNFISRIKNTLTFDIFEKIPTNIEDPSSYLLARIIISVLFHVFESIEKSTIYPSETINCFSAQFGKELTPDTADKISGTHLILKILAEWTKNYPNIIQEENKILQEYNLTSEKLYVLSFVKSACDNQDFKTPMTALANSPMFPQIFDCPLGSKMNAATKCNLW